MGVYIALLCVGVLLVASYLFLRTKKPSLVAVFIKIGASLIFISICAYGLYLHHYVILPLMFVIGMVFGMLGDILLDLKYVFPEQDKMFTYSGFITFGIGHIFFISGMFRDLYHSESILYVILPFVFGLLMAVVTLLMQKPMKLKYGDMTLIVAIYAYILFSMTGTAISLSILNKFMSTTLILLTIGGALFAISDLILSQAYFGGKEKDPIVIILNICTYYSAQYLLASAIFFI